MELKAKIIGVEQAFDGIIIIIQQEKMRIPVAEDVETDEAIFAKKFAKGLKGIGFNFQMMSPNSDVGFRTGFWLPTEDYEQLGKPSVGDVLKLEVKLDAWERQTVAKPLTPAPSSMIVLATLKRLDGTEEPVGISHLMTEVEKKFKMKPTEIALGIKKLLQEGSIYEPKEGYLRVT